MREALQRGATLFDVGDHFDAHEVWEDAWRELADGPDRSLLQGLIQCAAAAIKVREGTWRGAATLTERATAHLAGHRLDELDLGRLVEQLRAAIDQRDTSAVLRCAR